MRLPDHPAVAVHDDGFTLSARLYCHAPELPRTTSSALPSLRT